MKKIRVVQFNPECGARILINPDNLDELAQREDTLVNPDLREVKGVPTCFWKKVGHEVKVMTPEEMDAVKSNFVIEAMHSPEVTDQDLKSVSDKIVSKIRTKLDDALQDIDLKFVHINACNYNLDQRLMKLEKKIKILLVITSVSLMMGVLFGILR